MANEPPHTFVRPVGCIRAVTIEFELQMSYEMGDFTAKCCPISSGPSYSMCVIVQASAGVLSQFTVCSEPGIES
jgi:hypothetical protein